MKKCKYLTLIFILALTSCDRSPHHQGYVESELIFISSPSGGLLENLAVARGQHVSINQLLYKLDPKPESIDEITAQDELAQAQKTLIDLMQPKRPQEIKAIEAQIAQTNAEIELARVRLERTQNLVAKKVASKDELDAALANYKSLVQQKSQYESNLELAKLGSRYAQIQAQQAQVNADTDKYNKIKWQLNQKTRFSPGKGNIFDTYFLPGEWVPAGQPVLSLLTKLNTRIEFFVPEVRLADFKLNQKIVFTCSTCKARGEAKVVYISPEVEYMPPVVYSRDNQNKLVFRIKAQILSPDGLKPGMPIEVVGFG